MPSPLTDPCAITDPPAGSDLAKEPYSETFFTYDILNRPIELEVFERGGDTPGRPLTFQRNVYEIMADGHREMRTFRSVARDATDTVETHTVYDHFGRVVQAGTNPDDPQNGGGYTFTTFDLDPTGLNRVTIEPYVQGTPGSPNPKRRTFVYDWVNNLKRETHPEISHRDAAGDLVLHPVTYEVNDRDLVTRRSIADAEEHYRWTYDLEGRVATEAFSEDGASWRPLKEYAYDPDRNTLQTATAYVKAGDTSRFVSRHVNAYDAMNRPTSVTTTIPEPFDGPALTASIAGTAATVGWTSAGAPDQRTYEVELWQGESLVAADYDVPGTASSFTHDFGPLDPATLTWWIRSIDDLEPTRYASIQADPTALPPVPVLELRLAATPQTPFLDSGHFLGATNPGVALATDFLACNTGTGTLVVDVTPSGAGFGIGHATATVSLGPIDADGCAPFSLTFDPPASGTSFAGSATFTGPGGTRTLALTATVSDPSDPPTATLTCAGAPCPAPLDFGPIEINTVSPPKTIRIGNTGGGTLIGSLSFGGYSSFKVAPSQALTYALASGEHLDVAVVFAPTRAVVSTATLSFGPAADGSHGTIDLTGEGQPESGILLIPDPPISHDFGAVAVGDAATIPQRVWNEPSATGDLTVTAEVIAGGSHFSIAGTDCLTGLAPGAFCEVLLTFGPQSLSPLDANGDPIPFAGQVRFRAPAPGGTTREWTADLVGVAPRLEELYISIAGATTPVTAIDLGNRVLTDYDYLVAYKLHNPENNDFWLRGGLNVDPPFFIDTPGTQFYEFGLAPGGGDTFFIGINAAAPGPLSGELKLESWRYHPPLSPTDPQMPTQTFAITGTAVNGEPVEVILGSTTFPPTGLGEYAELPVSFVNNTRRSMEITWSGSGELTTLRGTGGGQGSMTSWALYPEGTSPANPRIGARMLRLGPVAGQICFTFTRDPGYPPLTSCHRFAGTGIPRLNVPTAPLDFGDVFVWHGNHAARDLDYEVRALYADDGSLSTAPPFAIGQPSILSVPTRSGSRVEPVFFRPEQPGPVSGSVRIELLPIPGIANSGELVDVPVTGRGVTPVLETPGTIDLGPAPAGWPRQQWTLVTNPTALDMKVRAEITSASGDFSLSLAGSSFVSWTERWIPAGSSVSFGVRFVSTTAFGHQSGMVRFHLINPATGQYAATAFQRLGVNAEGGVPVGHWDFDDGTLRDSSVAVNDGIGEGAAAVASGQLRLDGASGTAMRTQSDVDFAQLPEGSFCGWVRFDDVQASQTLVGATDAQAPELGLEMLGASGGHLLRATVQALGGPAGVTESVAPMVSDAWTHVCAVYRGAGPGEPRLILYIDGESAGVVVSPPGSGGILDLGNAARFGIGLAGRLDDLRLWNRALAPEEVPHLLDPDIVHWSFDRAPGSGDDEFDEPDVSGNGRGGTFFGNAKRYHDASIGEGALELDGSGDLMTAAPIALHDDLTIAMWVRWDDVSRRQFLIQAGSSYRVEMQGDGGGNRFLAIVRDRAGRRTQMQSTTSAVPDRWYHLAIAYDGERVRMFVDGVEEGTALERNAKGPVRPTGATTVGVGAAAGSALYPVHGYLDEVMLFRRALSPALVGRLLANTPPAMSEP